VLLVPDTVVVHYDFLRGEPRGKIKKANPIANMRKEIAQAAFEGKNGMAIVEESPLKLQGDCIDCKLCVQVCPTGIDIRNGTQLECVNCTACIDACDEVMAKVGRPKGLIRYDSYNGIKKGRRKIFNTRAVAYSVVLLVLIVFQAFLFATRSEVEALVLRTPGQLYQKVDETYLSNLYNWEVINKTGQDFEHIEFKVANVKNSRIRMVGTKDNVVSPKQGLVKGVLFIDLPKAQLEGRKTKLRLEVWSNGKLIDKTTTNFLGPIK
jgi:cytochrome c oxidase accessory protein FixG